MKRDEQGRAVGSVAPIGGFTQLLSKAGLAGGRVPLRGGSVQNPRAQVRLYWGSFSQIWRIADREEYDPNVTKFLLLLLF